MEARTDVEAKVDSVVDVKLRNVGSGVGVVYDADGKMVGVKPGEVKQVAMKSSAVAILKRRQSKGGSLRVIELDPITGEAEAIPTNPALDVLTSVADGVAYHELLAQANAALGGTLTGRPSRHEIVVALATRARAA